jgi:membrane protease YdiL (CAAX protease family)
MVRVIVLAVIIAIISFDLSILRKQDENLFQKVFRFPRWLLIGYPLGLLALLILGNETASLNWFFFFFIFPIYLLRRRKFRKAFFQSSDYVIAVPSQFTLVSDAISLLWTWFLSMMGVIFVMEVIKKMEPAFFSELGEVLTIAITSSSLLILFIYQTIKRYPGLSFNEAIALKTQGRSWHQIVTVPAILGLAVAGLSAYLIVSRDVQPSTPLGNVLESNNGSPLVVAFLLMAVFLAPILEEIIFRGYFFYVLNKYKGQAFAIYAIALIFGLMHVEQYWGDWLAILMVGILGLILSYLRAWTKTSVATMVTHFFYNGTMTILPVIMVMIANPTYYQYQNEYKNLDFHGKETLLKESIDKNPKFPESYNDLAWLYAESDTNLDEALDLIDKALELYPKKFAYLDTKAEILFKMGRLDEAIAIAEDLVKRYPNEAYAKEQLKKFQQALMQQKGIVVR